MGRSINYNDIFSNCSDSFIYSFIYKALTTYLSLFFHREDGGVL